MPHVDRTIAHVPIGRARLVASLLACCVLGCREAPELDTSRFIRYPSTRAVCADRSTLRNAYFGDLHVHTRLSFDAASAGNRSTPDDAYRFAKGEPIGLPPYNPDGTPSRMAQLAHPLDFVGLTDHSEFLAETSICLDPTAVGYDSDSCLTFRSEMANGGGFGDFFLSLITTPPERRPFCANELAPYCRERMINVWRSVTDAAEAHDDRSSDCSFSTFIGYEWTGTLLGNNWHRNIIFGTSTVPRSPISFIEAWTPELLWDSLHSECLDAGVGCDVVSIPHNLNVSGGLMFQTVDQNGAPYTAELAARRRAIEPLAEIYQHKGNSECTMGAGPFGSTDEACRDELVVPNLCVGANDPPGCTPLCVQGGTGAAILGYCATPSDFARGALRQGIEQWAQLGVNPFAFGFIGSTDTHNATPGNTDEATFPGHVGIQDATPETRIQGVSGLTIISRYASPGGLAGVWAEENSRPSLFSALHRRETFATTGTRLLVRFFGGWGYDANLCSSTQFVSRGYSDGVPMGGDLPAQVGTAAPTFAIQAMQAIDGEPLQRVEVVKGWYDGVASHEQVFVAGGDANNGATVDPVTCTTSGPGAASLCTVWTDPTFDATQAAFYYARVLENPSCRWHRVLCNQVAPDCSVTTPTDPLWGCCDPSMPDHIQERAWSSPIWYYPPTP